MENINEEVYKTLILEMSTRLAALEKILLEKQIISLEELSSTEDQLTDELIDLLKNNK